MDSDVEEGETHELIRQNCNHWSHHPWLSAGQEELKLLKGNHRDPRGKDTPTFLVEHYLITYPCLNVVSEALLTQK